MTKMLSYRCGKSSIKDNNVMKKRHMKSINHVMSMDQYGCAIACLAMIARTSYFEMREKLSYILPRYREKIINLVTLQLHADEIHDILKTHLDIRCRGVKFVSPMKNHCILYITNVDLGRSGHGVVWDAKQQKILDPDCSLANLDDFNVYYCIEILPPKTGLEMEQRGEEKYYRFNGVGPRVLLRENNKLEYILVDLSLTQSDITLLSDAQKMSRITLAIGLTESQIKQKLRQLSG